MKPVLQALILADRIYTDAQSGKKVICGTFNTLFVGKIAIPQPESADGKRRRVVPGGTDVGCPAVYMSLTDVVDGTEIRMQFVNVSKNAVLLEVGFRITSKDRLATIEIVAPLPPIRQFAKEAGSYSLDVVWNNEILGSHRVRVLELPAPEQGEEDVNS